MLLNVFRMPLYFSTKQKLENAVFTTFPSLLGAGDERIETWNLVRIVSKYQHFSDFVLSDLE